MWGLVHFWVWSCSGGRTFCTEVPTFPPIALCAKACHTTRWQAMQVAIRGVFRVFHGSVAAQCACLDNGTRRLQNCYGYQKRR